jgi:hypothetical protein
VEVAVESGVPTRGSSGNVCALKLRVTKRLVEPTRDTKSYQIVEGSSNIQEMIIAQDALGIDEGKPWSMNRKNVCHSWKF